MSKQPSRRKLSKTKTTKREPSKREPSIRVTELNKEMAKLQLPKKGDRDYVTVDGEHLRLYRHENYVISRNDEDERYVFSDGFIKALNKTRKGK